MMIIKLRIRNNRIKKNKMKIQIKSKKFRNNNNRMKIYKILHSKSKRSKNNQKTYRKKGGIKKLK